MKITWQCGISSHVQCTFQIVALVTSYECRLSCDDIKCVSLSIVWALGPPLPPNGHPLFDKVNIDLVNCHRNYDVIKSINMLHFTNVAKILI
jgi:hypothetical protein